MVKWIILGVIGYLLMWFITLVLMVYTDRKDGSSPNFVYRDEDFVEYMGMSLLWFIILPILLACYCETWLKKIVATAVNEQIRKISNPTGVTLEGILNGETYIPRSQIRRKI